jgi:hypothetical protein
MLLLSADEDASIAARRALDDPLSAEHLRRPPSEHALRAVSWLVRVASRPDQDRRTGGARSLAA